MRGQPRLFVGTVEGIIRRICGYGTGADVFGQKLSNIAKMGHLAAIAGDQLKAFITENFGEEMNEVRDAEGWEGAHVSEITATVYYKN